MLLNSPRTGFQRLSAQQKSGCYSQRLVHYIYKELNICKQTPKHHGLYTTRPQTRRYWTRTKKSFSSKSSKKTSRLTQKEDVTLPMIEVSDFLIISPEIASSWEKIFEISSSIVDNSSNARPRTLIAKGRKYNCTLKKNAIHNTRNKARILKSRRYFHPIWFDGFL